MLDRNKGIKAKPERFQDCKNEFDLVVTCEGRVYDQVLQGHCCPHAVGLEMAVTILFICTYSVAENWAISADQRASSSRLLCARVCVRCASPISSPAPRLSGAKMPCLFVVSRGPLCPNWPLACLLRTRLSPRPRPQLAVVAGENLCAFYVTGGINLTLLRLLSGESTEVKIAVASSGQAESLGCGGVRVGVGGRVGTAHAEAVSE